jgi:Putative MetA-pathway of phenol degradation
MKSLPLIIAAAAVACARPGHAQTLTRDELTQALQQRDQMIASLQARIEALEQAQHVQTVQTSVPSPQVATAVKSAETSSPSEDDTNLEALSRTLVQRGGLVLQAWQAELIPSAAYSNRIVQGLTLVQTPEGIPTVADQRLREDQVRGSLAVRLGLPLSSQIEVQIPYNRLRRSRSLGDGSYAVNNGSGIGDVEVALSHQFSTEKGWRPALVGGVAWRFKTGQNPFRTPVAAVATGSGTDQFRARITALKTSEPLVFFGTLSYAHDLPSQEIFGRVQTGDALGLQLGMALSLNPDTSMTFGLSQDFRGRTKLDGDALPGTDTLSSSLLLGIGRVLTPNLLLDVSLGVGLTRDTPDYVFQVSLPFRFR